MNRPVGWSGVVTLFLSIATGSCSSMRTLDADSAVCAQGVCGLGGHNDDGQDASPTDATVFPECPWPTSLTADESAAPACRSASRTVLTCTDPTDVTETCLTNDPAACPDTGPSASHGPWLCQRLCSPQEFGIICGSVGPTSLPDPQPPAGCHDVLPTPAGVVFYCCPCGS